MSLKRSTIISIALFLFILPTLGYAQTGGSYELSWSTIDGGGGTSSGNYTLSGTIGQQDTGNLSGGNYTLVGGFWVGEGPGEHPAAAMSICRLY